MKNLQNSVLTITMAIGLAITGLTPAHASTTPIQITSESDSVQSVPDTVTAAIVSLPYDKTTVQTSTAAPAAPAPSAKPVDASAEIVQPQTSESVSTAATTVQPKAATPVSAAPAPVPVPANPVAPVSGNAIVNAALAQLGVHQDCTALVSNALAAVGIHFHSAPAGYLSLGHVVPAAAAQPGDLVYYANGGMGMPHIAVYIGGGQAVHGGWNGGTTAIASVGVGSGPVYIHIG